MIQILKKARDIISKPKNWTYAKDKNGTTVMPLAASAKCFCSLGAISRAAFELSGSPKDMSSADAALRSIMGINIIEFNDNHKDV